MKLYNTLTRSVEDVSPINDSVIKMYTCGITVYSQPHIGNWLAYIYSDVLHRTLIASGYTVERTQNITDVGHLVSDDDSGEDKMEKGAKKEGLSAWEVADKYIQICTEEAKLLNLLPVNHLIRATDLINEQIEFVQQLEQKGYTYQIEDGVYFDTSKISDYGKLARLDIEGLEAGARVEVNGKKNKTDFALWKLSPLGQKRDMEWDSPWGRGFPGWHLECSVIARETLGDQIDIHTGGIDHIPVHHTNEIAQTETLTGKIPFSRFWFHNNHIKVNGTKISKSLGNIYTIEDVVQRGYTPEAFRIMVLSSHFRTEGNFTWEILDAAQNRLQHFQNLADYKYQPSVNAPDYNYSDAALEFLALLQDNLNTPQALAFLSETFDTLRNQRIKKSQVKNFQTFLELIDSLLGTTLSSRSDISDGQKQLLQERQKAREKKDWKKSDEIRDILKKQGIELSDSANEQLWARTNQ